MNSEIITDVYGLMALLNELYRAGQRELLLFMPYLKEPLFAIHLNLEKSEKKSSVEFLPRYPAYRNFLDKQKSGFLRKEIPDYGTLQALLLQAGIVEYPNFTDFLALLQRMCQRDFHKGDRPVFMGLDTNLFRDLFYSAHYHILEHIPDNKIGFSVSPNVKDELTFDRKKYRNHDLRDLSEVCTDHYFKRVTNGFFNQPCLHDRLRRLGWVELDKVKRIHWIELLPELDERELESSSDLNIIKTYKLAAAERNVDILLLSRDDGFIGHAQGIPGLVTFQIQNPNFKGHKHPAPKWRNVCQLLYLAAVVCGVIRVQSVKNSYLMQGIWKGKKSTDWNRERIQIQPLNESSQIFDYCEKAWRVIGQGEARVEGRGWRVESRGLRVESRE